MLYLAADHAGFALKEDIAHRLADRGVAFEDFGTFSTEPVDYPGLAMRLAKAVSKTNGRGIMICASGEGMAMTANRRRGVRAAVVWDVPVTVETREDNDANVIALPARHLSKEKAWDIVSAFLSTTFNRAERHQRRIKQIDERS